MKPEKKIILSDVTQTQKDKQYVFTPKWILDVKQRITRLQSTTPEKVGNKEDFNMMYMDSPVKQRWTTLPE